MEGVPITDEEMGSLLTTSRPCTVVILRRGPSFESDSPVIWEHGRRNLELRADGRLSIVCPVIDGSDVTGIGVFNLDETATRAVMQDDPGVRAGVFVFETHTARTFPGDSLPSEPWRASP